MDFGPITDTLRAELDTKLTARESALSSSRSAIRACGNAIRALHRHESEAVAQLLDEAEAELNRARAALERHPDMLYAGFVHDAEKEFAEARITSALVHDEELPSVDDLEVSAQAYLKGMAESIGELRRHILDLMRHGELERCEKLLGAMDDMYYVLVSMDYPDGITYGLRRLTDIARSIIERTRGDFTTSTIQSSLRAALEQRQEELG
ncbi:MAG TPA: haloacid dehalogenase [Actinomycetota bacterium]|nr:haloacid dehalogenase [Actinomycetota bacterium]